MTSPGDDPFYNKLFYTTKAGQTAQASQTFELTEVPDGNVELTVYVGAYSNTPHHLQVSINGSQVASAKEEDGWRDIPVEITIGSNMLNVGTNTITIATTAQSDAFDVYTYDKLVIRYDSGEVQEPKTAKISLGESVNKSSILPQKGSNYVIISHPMFMGDTLNRYIGQKAGEGWNIHLVSVEDIYNAFGYGMATPQAILAYLKEAETIGATHIQLVGSASYDYHDTLGLGSISFIPSLYAKTGAMNKYTPCDSCLVANNEGIPNMAIGRWAVRTLEGLEAVVNKSLAWKDSGQSKARSALFIADKKDEAMNLDFSKQQDNLSAHFENNGAWQDITRIYFDEYAAKADNENPALPAVRDDIQKSLNDGVSVTSFSGHSTYSKWSFMGMLTESDIASISNTNQTTIALPLACYTTYADSPRITTLAHQLMAAGENGAAAIYGAATLSDFSDNRASAAKVIDYLLEGKTIGEAIQKAKADLGENYLDVIRNSNLLGDVTLRIE